jgi:ABC-type uncharacterized transport system auxiliary subunit
VKFKLHTFLKNRVILLLGAALILASCKPTIAPMTAQELKTMNELTQSMQTHCVGRFLIDLPSDAKIASSQAVGYRGEVAIVTIGKMSEEAFDKLMLDTEVESVVSQRSSEESKLI